MEGLGLTLIELEAHFIGQPYANDRGNVVYPYADTLAEAKGVRYLCPKCFAENGGRVGTHGVINFCPEVGQEFRPTPGRWHLCGTGLHDLSLVNGSSSVALDGHCAAHFFVTDGRIADRRSEQYPEFI